VQTQPSGFTAQLKLLLIDFNQQDFKTRGDRFGFFQQSINGPAWPSDN
jgi:hypothetical protein